MKFVLLSPLDYNFYNFRSELILELVSMGNEVILVCPYGRKIDYFLERGCRFFNISVDRRGKNIWRDVKLIIKYFLLINKEKPDLVLTYTGKPSIYGGLVCGMLRVPYIVNNAGLMESTGLFDIFMKLLYCVGFYKASCIMFQNSQEREVIEKVLRNKVRHREIPGSGVNLNEFCYKTYPKDDEIIFNYIGRIVSTKGIDEYLACAEIIKQEYPNTKFYIYGDYDDYMYKEKINTLESDGIVIYGGVQMDIKPYIEKAHAVIHPSHYEGMTNVILEHSAMGRVSIASDIPGVREGIDDKKTGFLFKVKNVNSMVDAVSRFIELPYYQKVEMGIAARKKMENEFDRKVVTEIYLEEIQRIFENKI